MVIVSQKNPVVKTLSSLKEKKGRREHGAFLVEGVKMVREAIASGMEIVTLAVREGETFDFSIEPVVLGEDAMRAVCDEKTPQGVVAAVKLPKNELVPPEKPCLLLDGVSDPANMGAIIRSANASGYEEIYCIDCVDPYSPKSVRASMSGVFFVKLRQGKREEVLSVLKDTPILAADMRGENVFTFTPPEKFALCVGNEGRGLSDEVRNSASRFVRIPMGANTESLNAAVSASITMYLLKKQFFEKQ